MEIETPPPPPPPVAAAVAAAAAISSVLGDDDLLREILHRLGLPTALLCAALVSRRWLRHASDPAFLRAFRARHPPALLGAYLSTAGGAPLPRFLPTSTLPPELAAAARRAGSFFDGAAFRGSSAAVRYCRGGRLLVAAYGTHYGHTDSTHLVCSPLTPAGGAAVVPPPAPPLPAARPGESVVYHCHEFLPGGGGDGRSYSCVMTGYSGRQTTVHLYELQDMHWVLRASAAARLPVSPPRSKVVLVDDTRFYMLSATNKILVCDFPSSSISAMALPNGVEDGHTGRIMLSRGDGSGGIYLFHVEGSQLRVFRGDDNAGNWFLADTVCLRQVCSNLGVSVGGHNAGVKLHAAWDSARFVFLEILGAIVFLDITSRKAECMS